MHEKKGPAEDSGPWARGKLYFSPYRALSSGVGNLFSAQGHLDIYSIICGPCKIINIKISLLYLVKH